VCGLPKDQYPTRFIPEGETQTPYTIVIGGRNFGCGSSRDTRRLRSGRRAARRWWRKVSRAFFFVTA